MTIESHTIFMDCKIKIATLINYFNAFTLTGTMLLIILVLKCMKFTLVRLKYLKILL